MLKRDSVLSSVEAPPWNIPRGALTNEWSHDLLCGQAPRNECWVDWFSHPLEQAGPSTGSGQVFDAAMLERGCMVAERQC